MRNSESGIGERGSGARSDVSDGLRQRPNISDERDAVISVFDHGFLYGEGIYETLRTYNRRLFLFDRHVRRLRRSAGMIALDVPFSDAELLQAITGDDGARATSADEAYVRVLVTRGVGELTYDPKATPAPSLVIIVKPQVDPPAAAYRDGVARRHRRHHPEPSGLREPDDQEQQPDEQRAGDAGGASARRVRRRDAELPRRADRVHDRRTCSS